MTRYSDQTSFRRSAMRLNCFFRRFLKRSRVFQRLILVWKSMKRCLIYLTLRMVDMLSAVLTKESNFFCSSLRSRRESRGLRGLSRGLTLTCSPPFPLRCLFSYSFNLFTLIPPGPLKPLAAAALPARGDGDLFLLMSALSLPEAFC